MERPLKHYSRSDDKKQTFVVIVALRVKISCWKSEMSANLVGRFLSHMFLYCMLEGNNYVIYCGYFVWCI